VLFKKIIIYLLTFTVVLPSNMVNDSILTCSNLIKHYQHHNEAHGQIGVVDFLIEHFTETDHTDPHPEHQESPFSNQHSTNFSINFLLQIPEKISFSLTSNFIVFEEIKIFFIPSFYFSPYQPNIWQPPQN
jgi:hypothetical protein